MGEAIRTTATMSFGTTEKRKKRKKSQHHLCESIFLQTFLIENGASLDAGARDDVFLLLEEVCLCYLGSVQGFQLGSRLGYGKG